MENHDGRGGVLLKIYMKKNIIVLILILTFTAGCGIKTPYQTISPVVVPPPYPQVLIVENNTQGLIKILESNESNTPASLNPGESLNIDFVVNRILLLDYSGDHINTTWVVEVDETNPYLSMKDIDAVFNVLIYDDETWIYRIGLGECWLENNPPTELHKIIIEEEPIIGVPEIDLCM